MPRPAASNPAHLSPPQEDQAGEDDRQPGKLHRPIHSSCPTTQPQRGDPDPRWPPKADEVWPAVEEMVEEVKPEDWPLNEGGRWWTLGQNTMAISAQPLEKVKLAEMEV